MALSAISLCSKALLKVGASGITSFSDGTVESEIAANLYPSIRDNLLSSFPWSFALAHKSLPRLAAQPNADFKYAYKLPDDFLRVISVGEHNRSKGSFYRIAENKLHSDNESVMLSYIFRPKEENFPPFFDTALIAALAAEFCLPLTESTTRSELLANLSEKLFMKAKNIDSQQNIPKALEYFPLIEVRK